VALGGSDDTALAMMTIVAQIEGSGAVSEMNTMNTMNTMMQTSSRAQR
jgi:hypothetical protein